MRIATNTLFDQTQSSLYRTRKDMLDVNTVVATGKKVNYLSDAPDSIATILSLKSSISNVTQLSDNIATGQNWLRSAETSISSCLDLVDDAKVLAINMNNGVISDTNLASASQEIEGIRDNLLMLANTKVNNQYIFSGTKTSTIPFEYDDPSNPTKLLYYGNHEPFGVKIGNSSEVKVGFDGEQVFTNKYITIDETNNKIDFREDPAGGAVSYGAELTATIPSGKYTADELAQAIEAAMDKRSASTGNPEVIDVSQTNATVTVSNYSALSIPTSALTPVSLTYNGGNWTVSGPPGYTPPIKVLDLNSDADKVELDFSGDGISDAVVKFDSSVSTGYNVTFGITSTAISGNSVDYDVSYNEGTKKYTIMENGGPTVLDNLQLMWGSGSNKDTSIGVDLGFDTVNVTGAPDGTNHVSNDEVEWGIFNTLKDLMGYLEAGDTEGINRSVSRLNSDFSHLSETVSECGIKQNRLEVRTSIISDLKISFETNRMKIEDADVIEAMSSLSQKEFAYQAALNATSKVMGLSILDYL